MENREGNTLQQDYREAVEPAFVSVNRHLGGVSKKIPPGRIAAYLTHFVGRAPGNLLNHVQRILLYRDIKDDPDAYGALLDLFIVLGEKGYALRRRMLTLMKESLTPEQYAALDEHLVPGIKKTDNVPPTLGSRLLLGVTGTTEIVERVAHRERTQFSALDNARDRLDSGDIHEARAILEQALFDEPENAEIAAELLAIYRHSRDWAAFNTIYTRIKDITLPGREDWDALASLMSSEQGSQHST